MPFHTFAVEPEMVTDTPEQYAKHIANRPARYLNSAKEAAAAAGVNCDTVDVEHDHPYQAIIDGGILAGMFCAVCAGNQSCVLSAAVHESARGTNAKCRAVREFSAYLVYRR